MFTFIHAADIHLDSPLKGLERYEGAPVEEIRGATRQALTNLVQLAIDRKVAFVLIAGDLYDGDWRDHNTGLFFVKQVTKLRDAGIHVYAVTGNHDAANIITKSLRLPKNPDDSGVLLSHNHVDTVELRNLGVAIHGRGFSDARITENVVGQYPAARPGVFNIGLLHTSLETESENEHARYAPCKIADLAAKYDYWALGHIHHQTIHHEDPWISFSGNTQGRHARETGPKGCHFVTVDDRGKAQVEFEPLDVFRWEHCRLDAQDCEDSDAVLDGFARELGKLYDKHGRMPLAVRVTISGRCPAHERMAADSPHLVNQIRAAAVDASDGRIWIERVRFDTSPSISFEQSLLRDGPIGELVRHLGDLRADQDLAAPLLGELDELYRKLPDELKVGRDGIDWAAPERLRDLLGDVEPLLVGRLLDQED